MGGLERRTAILKTLSPGDAQGFPGIMPCPPAATAITNLTLQNNRAVLVRFVPEEDMFVTKIGFHCGTLDAANPNVDVGILDATLANLICSAGPTAGQLNSTGIKTLPMVTPRLITAGTVYYAGLCSASAGVAAIQSRFANAAVNLQFYGASPPNIMACVAAVSAATLSAPLTFATGINNEVPLLAIRTD